MENLRYLSFWYNIFRLRVSVVDKEFDEARVAFEAALFDARYYKDLDRESDIFPNYFADFNDLQNEASLWVFRSHAQDERALHQRMAQWPARCAAESPSHSPPDAATRVS